MHNIVITLIFISSVYSILLHEIGNESNGFHIRCTCKKLCLVIMDCGKKKKNNTKNKNHYILLISYWLKNYDIGLHAPV